MYIWCCLWLKTTRQCTDASACALCGIPAEGIGGKNCQAAYDATGESMTRSQGRHALTYSWPPSACLCDVHVASTLRQCAKARLQQRRGRSQPNQLIETCPTLFLDVLSALALLPPRFFGTA